MAKDLDDSLVVKKSIVLPLVNKTDVSDLWEAVYFDCYACLKHQNSLTEGSMYVEVEHRYYF